MENMEQYILKIATNDAKGLIYNISKVLFANNLNIDTNAEYVDPQTKNFFMRSLISGNVSSNILLKELKEVLPQGSQITLNKRTKKDVVLLATKEAHVLGDLLIKYISNELNANIKAVIANHEDLRNLVEKFDIPFFCISADNLSKEQHEEFLKSKIDEFNPELIGANPYKQAFDRGVKIIGATAHFVTNDLDEGPIIYQDVVRVDHTYSWEDMRNAGRDVEKVVLSNAFELLLEDRVFVFKNKTVIL